MKYMLLTYLDENAWLALTEEQRQAEMAKCEPHVRRLVAGKKVIDGAPLQATSSATTIRVKQKKRLVTDGPFAETREQLGGYTHHRGRRPRRGDRHRRGVPRRRQPGGDDRGPAHRRLQDASVGGQTGVETGVRPGSDRGQTGVRPGSDRGQTGVRPGSDPALSGVLPAPLLLHVGIERLVARPQRIRRVA